MGLPWKTLTLEEKLRDFKVYKDSKQKFLEFVVFRSFTLEVSF
jgi:hypothetical protein